MGFARASYTSFEFVRRERRKREERRLLCALVPCISAGGSVVERNGVSETFAHADGFCFIVSTHGIFNTREIVRSSLIHPLLMDHFAIISCFSDIKFRRDLSYF